MAREPGHLHRLLTFLDPLLRRAQVGVCVLVKTKKPSIRWHFTRRSPQDVIEYLQKVDTVTSAIRAGVFYRRLGKWCRQCEYLPVCTGDTKNTDKTLVKIQ